MSGGNLPASLVVTANVLNYVQKVNSAWYNGLWLEKASGHEARLPEVVYETTSRRLVKYM